MKTYAEARALAGTSEPCSFAGGRARFLTWSLDADDAVLAEIYGTAVVRFYPDRVEVRTAGYPTPSTFDAISTALVGHADRYSVVGTVSRVPYVFGHRMTEPTVLTYSGERIGDLWDDRYPWTPLAPARRADLDVVDVSPQGPPATSPVRVTLRDWTHDGRDHTATMRRIAAAYVGRRGARTRVVRRDHSPTHEEPLVTILVETEA